MNKWNLVVDVSRCNNCVACQLATMDEYAMNDFPGYAARAPKDGAPWIAIRRVERGQGTQVDVSYLPTMCNHCDNAPCGAGRDEALVKRSDGVVLLVPEKARGRKDLVGKCPYGAIFWNDELELPQLWSFDAHLLDAGWKAPRCVHACPTQALQAHRVSDEAMKGLVQEHKLEVLKPELGTRPRVYYKDLYRVTQRFVAATVVGQRAGRLECLLGAAITLEIDGGDRLYATTDTFGDFKLDGLQAMDQACELRIECPGYKPAVLPLQLNADGVSLGEVELEAL